MTSINNFRSWQHKKYKLDEFVYVFFLFPLSFIFFKACLNYVIMINIAIWKFPVSFGNSQCCFKIPCLSMEISCHHPINYTESLSTFQYHYKNILNFKNILIWKTTKVCFIVFATVMSIIKKQNKNSFWPINMELFPKMSTSKCVPRAYLMLYYWLSTKTDS